MSAQDDARIVLCRVCNRQLCDYPCNKIHLMSEIIAEAQLEAVEKWMAMTYDCIGKNGVIATEHFNYLAELRKAAGKGE